MGTPGIKLSLNISASSIPSDILKALGIGKINKIFRQEVITPALKAIKRRTPGKEGKFRKHWVAEEYQKSKAGLLQKVRIRFDEDSNERKVIALAALEKGTKAYTIPARGGSLPNKKAMAFGKKSVFKKVKHGPHKAFHMIGDTKKEIPSLLENFKERVSLEFSRKPSERGPVVQIVAASQELIRRAGRIFVVMRDALGRFAKKITG